MAFGDAAPRRPSHALHAAGPRHRHRDGQQLARRYHGGGSRVFFTAADATGDQEIYVWNGTSSGTQRVANLTTAGSTSDGSVGGTRRVDSPTFGSFSPLRLFAGGAAFAVTLRVTNSLGLSRDVTTNLSITRPRQPYAVPANRVVTVTGTGGNAFIRTTLSGNVLTVRRNSDAAISFANASGAIFGSPGR